MRGGTRRPKPRGGVGGASDARFCPLAPQPAAALRGAGRLPPGRPNSAAMGCGKPGPLELAGSRCELALGGEGLPLAAAWGPGTVLFEAWWPLAGIC